MKEAHANFHITPSEWPALLVIEGATLAPKNWDLHWCHWILSRRHTPIAAQTRVPSAHFASFFLTSCFRYVSSPAKVPPLPRGDAGQPSPTVFYATGSGLSRSSPGQWMCSRQTVNWAERISFSKPLCPSIVKLRVLKYLCWCQNRSVGDLARCASHVSRADSWRRGSKISKTIACYTRRFTGCERRHVAEL